MVVGMSVRNIGLLLVGGPFRDVVSLEAVVICCSRYGPLYEIANEDLKGGGEL